MKTLNRRKFLLLAGAGSAAASVGGAVPAASLLARARPGVLRVRASAGVPAAPLPAYATLVIEGHVDLATGSGMLTKTVFAGAPAAMSRVALPGMSQTVRITTVREAGGLLHLTGVVDDRSQLALGESQLATFQIDRSSGAVQAHLFGQEVALHLER